MQEIYEGRFASLHRLVAFFVMFHAMAKKVQDFWPRVSFGLLGYDMSRSQSIMRIATTASPVSGADVRHKMVELAETTLKLWCVNLLKTKWILRHGRIQKFDDQSDAALDAQIERLMNAREARKSKSKLERQRERSRILHAETSKLSRSRVTSEREGWIPIPVGRSREKSEVSTLGLNRSRENTRDQPSEDGSFNKRTIKRGRHKSGEPAERPLEELLKSE